MAHPELGKKVLDAFVAELGSDMVIDAPPKMQGRSMNMTVSKKKKG